MGQTVLDQDIIPIGNLPRLENVCEEAIADQFHACDLFHNNHSRGPWGMTRLYNVNI
jgi:hypothetical protein